MVPSTFSSFADKPSTRNGSHPHSWRRSESHGRGRERLHAGGREWFLLSRLQGIDVGDLVRPFGGGGDARAADFVEYNAVDFIN